MYQDEYLKTRKQYLSILESLLRDEVDDVDITFADNNVEEFTVGHSLFQELFTLTDMMKADTSKADLIGLKPALDAAFQQFENTCYGDHQMVLQIALFLREGNYFNSDEWQRIHDMFEPIYHHTIRRSYVALDWAFKLFLQELEVADEEESEPEVSLVAEAFQSTVLAKEFSEEMKEAVLEHKVSTVVNKERKSSRSHERLCLLSCRRS